MKTSTTRQVIRGHCATDSGELLILLFHTVTLQVQLPQSLREPTCLLRPTVARWFGELSYITYTFQVSAVRSTNSYLHQASRIFLHYHRAESSKIYPSFTLTAVALAEFSAATGSNDDSVAGYPKAFYPTGSGIAEGDQAKWVAASVTNDAGCNLDGVVDESSVTWTAGLAAATPSTLNVSTSSISSSTSTSFSGSTGEELILASSFTFLTPTLGSARVKLCYKHRSEPYHLHSTMTLRTRQLVSAAIRELDVAQTLVSITNSPQAISFVAHGGMEGDRYKWVATISGTSEKNDFDLCAKGVGPAAGSSIGVAMGFYQVATFMFSVPASDLMLCYAPGSEPFMPYPSISMGVLDPVISSASATHVIVGRDSTVRLVGTFGLTSGDAVKLAQNKDGDCEGDPAGGDGAIFYPDRTAPGLTKSTLGTSEVTLSVSDRTEDNQPFKICYRFGEKGVWELFDNVSFEAYEVTGVSVKNSGGSLAAGMLLDFTFSGTGIVNGGNIESVSSNSYPLVLVCFSSSKLERRKLGGRFRIIGLVDQRRQPSRV